MFICYIDIDIDSVVLELGAAEFGAQQVHIICVFRFLHITINMCLYICVSICVYICGCLYIISIYAYNINKYSICIAEDKATRSALFLYLSLPLSHIYIYIYIHIYIYIYTYIYIHTYIYVCVSVCVCVCVYIYQLNMNGKSDFVLRSAYSTCKLLVG